MSVQGNAAGDHLLRTASLPSSTSFTICGWFKRTVTADGTFRFFLSLENTAYPTDSTAYCVMGWQNDQTFVITSAATGANFASAPATDAWFFAAIKCSGTGATDFAGRWASYGDSTFVGAAIPGLSWTPGSLMIMSDTFDEFFTGNAAHIRCWDVALTDAELLLEMYSTLPVRHANLNFAWRDISASSVTDLSGNARNATIGGTLTSSDDPPIDDLLFAIEINAALVAAGMRAPDGMAGPRRGSRPGLRSSLSDTRGWW